jgi:hypothetical protein
MAAFRNSGLQKLQQTIFETRWLPALTRSYPRHFTFYVAHPIRSIGDVMANDCSRAVLDHEVGRGSPRGS